MKRGPQGRYSKEFREEAVKLVMEERLSVPEAGRRLSLPPSTITSWVKQFKAGRLGEIGKTYRPLTEARILIEQWGQEYNHIRPHSSLGYQPPAPEAQLSLALT